MRRSTPETATRNRLRTPHRPKTDQAKHRFTAELRDAKVHLLPRGTRKEYEAGAHHPKRFGRRKSTSRIDCSGCNNRFGGTIDNAIAQQFAHLRNILQAKTGDGRLPPAIKNVNASVGTIDIMNDGTPRLRAHPFNIETTETGERKLQFTAHSLDQVAAMIPHIAKAAKLPEEKVRETLASTSASLSERRAGVIQAELSFGGLLPMRAAAKSALVLWATLVGTSEVRKPCYDAVRQFTLGNNDAYVETHTELDSTELEHVAHLTERFGRCFHLLVVSSDANGRVMGHYTLFNIISYFVVLAQSGGAPDRQTILAVDPIKGTWSDKVADELKFNHDRLSDPNFHDDTQRLSRRFGAVIEHHQQITVEKELMRIIDDVHRVYNFGVGTTMTDELASLLSRDMADRIVRLLLNQPYERAF
jgi:hypothetical protein